LRRTRRRKKNRKKFPYEKGGKGKERKEERDDLERGPQSGNLYIPSCAAGDFLLLALGKLTV